MMASYTVATVRTGRKPAPVLACSFCGKSEHVVEWLVASPRLGGTVSYICDDCTESALSTLKEARRIERSQRYR